MARLPYDALKLGKLIADVWDDPNKRYELLTNPRKSLTAAGVKIGKHQRVVVLEDTDSTVHVVIPRRPQKAHLTDDYLTRVGHGMLDGCDG